MTDHSKNGWRWSNEQIADLMQSWPDGESCASIGARLGRHPNAVSAKAHDLGLPSRREGSKNGRPGGSIAEGRAMRPELPMQVAQWADIRFDDDVRAAISEGRLQGLPPLNLSPQSTTAAFAAGE